MGGKEWLCDLGGGKQSCDLQRSGVKVDLIQRCWSSDAAETMSLKGRGERARWPARGRQEKI
jgi:hypothetical protein